jgi:hypothetical protein
MTAAALSMFAFGIYLLLSGLSLMLAPNMLFAILGVPASSEVWPRVVGMLTGILGFYFIQAARKNVVEFFRWTLYARFFVLIAFAAFVVLDLASPVLLLFGVIDALGAIWTALALRSKD